MSADELGGREIASVSLALTNVGDGLSKALKVRAADSLELGDKVHLVVEAVVGKIRFDLNKDDPDLVDEIVILRGGTIAIVDETFVSEKLEAQREANDRATGKQRLPFEKNGDAAAAPKGDVVTTDASGVVLTAKELAAARGIELADDDPVLVEVGNGAERLMWPDDFAKGEARPEIGWTMAQGLVTALLDPKSGAVLAEATPVADDIEAAAFFGQPQEPGEEVAAPVPSQPADASSPDGWEYEQKGGGSIEDLPSVEDARTVKGTVAEIVGFVSTVVDVAHLRRLRKAEQQRDTAKGVGRKAVLVAISNRIAGLGGE